MKPVQLVPTACQAARRYVDSYIDNELTVDSIHQVLPHLESCADCKRYFEERRSLKLAVKKAVLSTDSAYSADAAWLTKTLARDGALTRRVVMMAVPGALAAGVAGLGVFRFWRRRPDDVQMTRMLAAAVMDHKHCAMGGMYPATPRPDEEMAAALGPQYTPLIAVVRGLSSGYQVQEGHRCEVGGRNYIHFILKNGADLVSLTSFERMKDDPPLPVSADLRESVIDGFAVSGFVASRHVAAVVTADPAEARRVARLFSPGASQIL